MSRINEKLGLKRAPTRAMMRLPDDRAARNALTRAQCPRCGERGVIENTIHGVRRRMCSWCSFGWDAEEGATCQL